MTETRLLNGYEAIMKPLLDKNAGVEPNYYGIRQSRNLLLGESAGGVLHFFLDKRNFSSDEPE
jgi:hypothetical protein